jgi:predicted PurR-regulated permease PerM
VFNEIARVFGAYLRSQLIVAVSLGALVTVALSAIGLPYAVLLGAFAGLVELVPMLGPFLGAVPAIVVASAQPFPTVAWTIVAFVVIQQFESNFLVPRLTGHAVGLHPLAAMLALLAGFEAGGIVGALFAVPIVGLIWVLVSTAVLAWRGRRIELQRRRQRARPWRPRRRVARVEPRVSPRG